MGEQLSTGPDLSATRDDADSPTVVAIVLNWNMPDDTTTCLEQLIASDYARLRVIVVDNGSTDGSAGLLGQRFPGIDVIPLRENRGFAGGCNVGIARALTLGADWILLVNNDAILDSNTITRLVEATWPNVGLAMPRIDAPPSRRLWHAGARIRGLNPLPKFVKEHELTMGTPVTIDYAVGCVLLIRRSVFERIGFFNEQYFMYYEDLDFSSRARSAGFQIIVVPGARALHHVGASLKSDTPRRTYLVTRYKTLWCRSQVLGPDGIAWWLSLLVGSWRGAARAIFNRNWRVIAAIGRGLRDGMRDQIRCPSSASRPSSSGDG